MKFTRLYLVAGGLILAGVLLLSLSLRQTVTILINGQAVRVQTAALTVGGALRSAGVSLSSGDRVLPSISGWLPSRAVIQVERAAQVFLLDGPSSKSLLTAERVPANLLARVGWKLYPGDRILRSGQTVDPYRPLPAASSYTLQLCRAVPVTVLEGNSKTTLYSSAATLGQALWDAGIRLNSSDYLSLPLDTPLNGPLQVGLQRARELTIRLGDHSVKVLSAATTVGEALADAGLSLQGLDYSQPAEDQPVPADGAIRVVRVDEQVLLEQKPIPFKSQLQPDANIELDTRQIIQPGQAGLQVTRVRVRREDGVEVSRVEEAQWVARQPKDQITGYGTKVVVHTTVVDGVSIEYWRAVEVYATSYSPCNLGESTCGHRTASGLPAGKGVIAVVRSWYNQMVGQRVYIPGYGMAVIGDIGGGVPGRYWIDLGYDDSNYVPWHQTVTLYFLTPVPANVPWILP